MENIEIIFHNFKYFDKKEAFFIFSMTFFVEITKKLSKIL